MNGPSGLTAQVIRLIDRIEQILPHHATAEDAANQLMSDFEAFGGSISDCMRRDFAIALEKVKERLGPIEILRRNSILKVRPNWYRGPKAGDKHWPAVEGFLRNTKGWGDGAIASIDESSTEVASLLADPSAARFRCRGLVVGYVQSGKTANMTAVIAKAVDAGYNLIVILAGMTNKLRAQTQARIESDVVFRHRHLWQLYTTEDDYGDFIVPANGSFTMPAREFAQLAVMKKECNRLTAFRQVMKDTPPRILESLKVLLIDDECDQASVNASSERFDMTAINAHIREIIQGLPAVSYIGYTATPFANVFTDPFPHDKQKLDDLYPEDFITALPRPGNYFGALEVFGKAPEDASLEGEVDDGKSMIRTIRKESLFQYRPTRRADKDSFEPSMGDELRDAVLWFLATCAIRRARGQGKEHMTMLVHTSPYVEPHARTAQRIRTWLCEHGDDLRQGSGATYHRLEQVIREETGKVALLEPLPRKDQFHVHLRDTLDALEVIVENGVSDDRINYSVGPRTYVVVGGSVLARGLTLEGLVVSFFLRTSRQYDTLLQMGRWFGFRQGYDDLPRLWTTPDLHANFRSLAQIEEEIREEIGAYRTRNATPLDFAVKVRAIPGMAITSANKMKNALRTNITFDGRHVQTIRFEHRDADVVSGNWKAASRLVDEIRAHGSQVDESLLFRDIPFTLIRRFFASYSISDAHMDLKQRWLMGYMDKISSAMNSWNVSIISPEKGPLSAYELGGLGYVPMVRRARLAGMGMPFADIKALMSKRDILIDVVDRSHDDETWARLKARRPRVPLLLLYPIQATSEPRIGSKTREALNAVGDLIGVGLVFPGMPDKAGNYYAVSIDAATPEELDQEEADLIEAES